MNGRMIIGMLMILLSVVVAAIIHHAAYSVHKGYKPYISSIGLMVTGIIIILRARDERN